jgi:hypothetical protein
MGNRRYNDKQVRKELDRVGKSSLRELKRRDREYQRQHGMKESVFIKIPLKLLWSACMATMFIIVWIVVGWYALGVLGFFWLSTSSFVWSALSPLFSYSSPVFFCSSPCRVLQRGRQQCAGLLIANHQTATPVRLPGGSERSQIRHSLPRSPLTPHKPNFRPPSSHYVACRDPCPAAVLGSLPRCPGTRPAYLFAGRLCGIYAPVTECRHHPAGATSACETHSTATTPDG